MVALWHALGEIYRSRLKDYKSATAAFEVCVQLAPDATARHQILAELYQLSGPESYDKAVAAYRTLIKSTQDVGQMAVYLKTLRKLFMEMRQYDRAFCVGAVARVPAQGRRRGDAVLRAVPAEGVHPGPGAAHRGAVARTSTIPTRTATSRRSSARSARPWPAAKAREHKEWGLKRKDKRDVANDQLLFSKVFNYVVQVFGVPQPELYLRPESPGELDLANAREKGQLTPSFVVGANLLQGRPEKELAYVIGKKLTLMRPDHFVRWPTVVPTVGRAEGGLPGGAAPGAAEVRGETRSAAAGWPVPARAFASWCRRRCSSSSARS